MGCSRTSKAWAWGEAFLVGLGVGAALTYLLDEDRGAYRRAVLRDRTLSLGRHAVAALDAALRDLVHRTQGLGARARGLLFGEAVSDGVLVERVRAQMGRCASHSRAIEILAKDGIVTLSGPILAGEAQVVVRRVKAVRGVRGVENELEVHETADIPDLRGGFEPRSHRSPVLFRSSSPATRLVLGAGGLYLSLRGVRARSTTGAAGAVLGALLLGSALVDTRSRRPRRRAISSEREVELAPSVAGRVCVEVSTASTEPTPHSSG